MKYSELFVAALVLKVSLRQAVWTASIFKLCTAFGACEELGIDLDRLSINTRWFPEHGQALSRTLFHKPGKLFS